MALSVGSSVLRELAGKADAHRIAKLTVLSFRIPKFSGDGENLPVSDCLGFVEDQPLGFFLVFRFQGRAGAGRGVLAVIHPVPGSETHQLIAITHCNIDMDAERFRPEMDSPEVIRDSPGYGGIPFWCTLGFLGVFSALPRA